MSGNSKKLNLFTHYVERSPQDAVKEETAKRYPQLTDKNYKNYWKESEQRLTEKVKSEA